APPTARAEGIASRLPIRARRPNDGQELRHAVRAPRQARRDALSGLPAHAQARLWLRPGQCRARHAGAAGLGLDRDYGTQIILGPTPPWRSSMPRHAL